MPPRLHIGVCETKNATQGIFLDSRYKSSVFVCNYKYSSFQFKILMTKGGTEVSVGTPYRLPSLIVR